MEGLTQELIHKEARDLGEAEREKTTLRPLTERYPKIEPQEAYRIQLALDRDEKSGRRLGLTLAIAVRKLGYRFGAQYLEWRL